VAPRILLIASASAALALRGLTVQAATLSLDVSNPYCRASQPERNRCSVNIGLASAVASDLTFSRIEIAIDGKLCLVEVGFFESSAYFNRTMVPDGLSVTCGFDGQGGSAGFGLSHRVNTSAYLSASAPVVAIANVTCPPASDHIFADSFEPGGAG